MVCFPTIKNISIDLLDSYALHMLRQKSYIQFNVEGKTSLEDRSECVTVREIILSRVGRLINFDCVRMVLCYLRY